MAQTVQNPPADAGDLGLIAGSERSPGEGPGNPLQYSCLENPMDGGAWGAMVQGVAESDTTERLTHTYFVRKPWRDYGMNRPNPYFWRLHFPKGRQAQKSRTMLQSRKTD